MASRKGYKVNLYDRCTGLLSDSLAASTVIVVGSESSRTPHILQDLKKAQWRIVVTNVDADHIDAHYSCATFSRRIITEQMLDHLLDKGCRRNGGLGAAFFCNNMVHQDAMSQYLLKYPYAEGACFEYQNRIDESFNAFYAMRDGFDAVVSANAFVAVAFLHFCEEKGIVVPNDLLVACMKDHFIGRYCNPSLTSLAVDFFAIGEQFVIVWQYLQEEGNERFRMRIAIQGHVIERESTGYRPWRWGTKPGERRDPGRGIRRRSFLHGSGASGADVAEASAKTATEAALRSSGCFWTASAVRMPFPSSCILETVRFVRVRKIFHSAQTKSRDEFIRLMRNSFTRNTHFGEEK